MLSLGLVNGKSYYGGELEVWLGVVAIDLYSEARVRILIRSGIIRPYCHTSSISYSEPKHCLDFVLSTSMARFDFKPEIEGQNLTTSLFISIVDGSPVLTRSK